MTTLYELTVPNYLQILDSVGGFLAKGKSHCESADMDPQSLVETSLHDDMLPLRFQLVSVAHHSLGALEGVQSGVFTPPPQVADEGFDALTARVAGAREGLAALDADAVNALAGKAMVFKLGEAEIPFTAENFIQSFSLPNFYFHATTAYDILRHRGVPLGKRDFLGNMRMGA
ncbi:MAG: DUF1993 domain-containing protein [Pseudomonadota bacterium]